MRVTGADGQTGSHLEAAQGAEGSSVPMDAMAPPSAARGETSVQRRLRLGLAALAERETALVASRAGLSVSEAQRRIGRPGQVPPDSPPPPASVADALTALLTAYHGASVLTPETQARVAVPLRLLRCAKERDGALRATHGDEDGHDVRLYKSPEAGWDLSPEGVGGRLLEFLPPNFAMASPSGELRLVEERGDLLVRRGDEVVQTVGELVIGGGGMLSFEEPEQPPLDSPTVRWDAVGEHEILTVATSDWLAQFRFGRTGEPEMRTLALPSDRLEGELCASSMRLSVSPGGDWLAVECGYSSEQSDPTTGRSRAMPVRLPPLMVYDLRGDAWASTSPRCYTLYGCTTQQPHAGRAQNSTAWIDGATLAVALDDSANPPQAALLVATELERLQRDIEATGHIVSAASPQHDQAREALGRVVLSSPGPTSQNAARLAALTDAVERLAAAPCQFALSITSPGRLDVFGSVQQRKAEKEQRLVAALWQVAEGDGGPARLRGFVDATVAFLDRINDAPDELVAFVAKAATLEVNLYTDVLAAVLARVEDRADRRAHYGEARGVINCLADLPGGDDEPSWASLPERQRAAWEAAIAQTHAGVKAVFEPQSGLVHHLRSMKVMAADLLALKLAVDLAPVLGSSGFNEWRAANLFSSVMLGRLAEQTQTPQARDDLIAAARASIERSKAAEKQVIFLDEDLRRELNAFCDARPA